MKFFVPFIPFHFYTEEQMEILPRYDVFYLGEKIGILDVAEACIDIFEDNQYFAELNLMVRTFQLSFDGKYPYEFYIDDECVDLVPNKYYPGVLQVLAAARIVQSHVLSIEVGILLEDGEQYGW